MRTQYHSLHTHKKNNIIMVGGKTLGSRYVSPSDVRDYIEAPGLCEHDRGIRLGHFLEYFTEHHGKDEASIVHFPRPDEAESLEEIRTSMYTHGRALSLTDDEIQSRVQTLLAEPAFGVARTLSKFLPASSPHGVVKEDTHDSRCFRLVAPKSIATTIPCPPWPQMSPSGPISTTPLRAQ